MNRFSRRLSLLMVCGAMGALIFDSRTAMEAAEAAVELCLRTAVPSLFPFFVLSGMILPHVSGLRIPWLGKLLGIPAGWESIFLLGCLGGYPIGAQCIAQACQSGRLDVENGKRMLGFCTNCGPSFLFGIVAAAFSDPAAPFVICFINLMSAMLVGCLLPTIHQAGDAAPSLPPVSLPQAVRQGTRSMVSVCAWIILGKVVLGFLEKWALMALPSPVRLLIGGLLELTNGCLRLSECGGERLRFVFACVFVSFGGISVAMQAAAICADAGLDSGSYLPQKTLQGALSALLALAYLYFPGAFLPLCLIMLLLCKKTVEIPGKMMYTRISKGGI